MTATLSDSMTMLRADILKPVSLTSERKKKKKRQLLINIRVYLEPTSRSGSGYFNSVLKRKKPKKTATIDNGGVVVVFGGRLVVPMVMVCSDSI